MFNTIPQTPQEFLNTVQDYFKAFPKTEKELKEVSEKVRNVYTSELSSMSDVYRTYLKVGTGDASMNEITEANKKAKDLMTSARFAAFLTIPGALFMLPAAIKTSKEYGLDFVPASVTKEFGI